MFTAQHATATCCRGCIAKWHGIPKGRALTDGETARLADLVMAWIDRDLAAHPGATAAPPAPAASHAAPSAPRARASQPSLF